MSNQFAKFLAVALVAVAATTGVAHANYLTGTFAVTAVEGQTYGYGFSATNTNPFAGYSSGTTASATYSYTGALNLSNTNNSAPDLNSSFGYTAGNLSNYSGSGTVSYNSSTVADYSSLTSYLNSSGSGSGLAYGSWYSFDLGVLSAGTVLTITHDDGVSVWQNNLNLGNTVSGPTSQVTDNVKLTSTTDTMLYYTRQNGAVDSAGQRAGTLEHCADARWPGRTGHHSASAEAASPHSLDAILRAALPFGAYFHPPTALAAASFAGRASRPDWVSETSYRAPSVIGIRAALP